MSETPRMIKEAAIQRNRLHSFMVKEKGIQHDQASESFNRKPFYLKKESEAATPLS